MNAKQLKARKRADALTQIAGALLFHGIHPDVCRIFDPRTFDRTMMGVTQAHMRRSRTIMPPGFGQLVNSRHWTLDALLPSFMGQVMVWHPELAPRDHLVGGFFMVMLAPWLVEDRGAIMRAWSDTVVDLTHSSEVADRLPDRGRTILAAYDRALAQVAAWEARDTATGGATT